MGTQRNVYLVLLNTSKLHQEQAHVLINVIHQQNPSLISLDVLAQRITLTMVPVEQPWSASHQTKSVRLMQQHKMMNASVIRVILEAKQTVWSVMLVNTKKDMAMHRVNPVLLLDHCLQVPLFQNPRVLHVQQYPIPLRAILKTAVYARRAMKKN